MKTVFHITSSNDFSGAEKIAMEIIKNTESVVKSCYICKPGPIEDFLKANGINYITYETVWDLLNIIKENHHDVLHCHDYTASILGTLSLSGEMISHIHHNAPFAKKLNIKSCLYLLSSIRYKKIVCVSEAASREMFFYKLLKRKVETIYNWVNLEERRWDIEEARDIDLLFVGRLTEPKNPFLFIDIVSELQKTKSGIKAVMLGDGDLRMDVENYISEKRVSNNIMLEGFNPTPHKFMKRAKLFLLTSNWEGFGLVILEAMLNGTIVVSRPIGGAKEIISDGYNGFLCENAESFVGIVNEVLNNSYNNESIISNALNSLENFDMNKQIEKIKILYSRLG